MITSIGTGFSLTMVIGTGMALFWRKKRSGSSNPYLDALHLLLEGKKTESIEKLRETVKQNTDNIMAYILLGDVYRESDDPSRAVKIHRNLLVRSDLKPEDKDKTMQHLVKDYRATGEIDKAIATAEMLYQKQKKNPDLAQLLLDLYISKGDWDKAFFHHQAMNRWQKAKGQEALALFKVEAGLALTKKNGEHEGRIRFREAIKLDKKCIPAHLYLGDSYFRVNRKQDALSVWTDFALKQPENAHYAFSRLEEVLYELGRYGEIESIYQKIASKKVKDEAVYQRLIELYIKLGKLQEASRLSQERLELNPTSSHYRYIQIQLLAQRNTQKALDEALHLLEDTVSRNPIFECKTCGLVSDEPIWYCPKCHQWNSYLQENS